MLLIYLSFAWVAGIFLGSRFALPPVFVLAGLIPLLLLFLRRHRKLIITTSVCLILLFSGAVYYQFRLPLTGESVVTVEWIDRLRNSLAQIFAEVLPEPQASLAQGIILGIRDNIPPSVQTDFAHTGTAHILAISGQNLSIVAGILVSFGIWLFGRRRYFYVWLALAVIWLYSLLTGMQPPVVRGAIMASLFLIADLLGRQHSAFTALAFAAALMVSVSPRVLWEASFQMSFMAMVGLIFVFPLFQSLGRKLVVARLGESGIAASAANFVVDSFSVSLGAIMAVWPLIAHYFGIISWIAPVATLIAVPALPGIIVIGAFTGVIGLAALPIAQVIGWVAWLFLSYMLLVVKAFTIVPFIKGVQIDTTLIWVYYSVLALIIWLANNRNSMTKVGEWLKSAIEKSSNLIFRLPMKWVVPSLAVVAILVWITVATLPDDNLHTSFLNVGQGDATLFQRGSQQVLVDGGPSPEALTLALGQEMPFWDRTIDLLILTHPHADHITGLLEALNRYRVKQVLYADLDDKSPLYAEWLKLIKEKNIDYTLARAGQRITLGSGVVIEVLNPPTPFLTSTDSDIDNNGVVVRLEMGEVSFLITGDIMWEGESELVTRRADLASTVLKVAHHGSKTSTADGFLGVVNPRLAVISVGKDNPFGHPTKEVMDRLKEKLGQVNIYRTDESGTIDLITDGEKLWVRVEKVKK
ncbi:MAG: DNA internalization-related competence protein ComEC/Rec2 [Chloroflexota bacterium]